MSGGRIPHSSSQVLAEDFGYIAGLGDSNFVGAGRQSAALRDELRAFCGAVTVLLCDSGTDALRLALLGLSRRYPDRTEVIANAYVCPAVPSAICQLGLTPVFADCNPQDMGLAKEAVARLIGPKTLAIICSHVGGIAEPVIEFAGFGVPVISDAAQALGSSNASGQVAAQGIMSVMSFGATKVITGGSGGALAIFDAELAESIAPLAVEELPVGRYLSDGFLPTWGQHFDDLRAGLVRAQLTRLPAMLAARRQIAATYDAALESRSAARLLPEAATQGANRFRYYVFVADRDARLAQLHAAGIDARPSIAHDMCAYFRLDERAFPNLGNNGRQLISLPIHLALDAAAITQVAEQLTNW